MSNTFTDNRDRWLQMSEIDYLGQFIKAWLAFNAWYRSAYSETQDRKIIEEIKWNPNTIAARFRPLLEQTSEEADQFRSEIGLLHHRLERYELHLGRGNDKTLIRLSCIIIRTEPPIPAEKLKHRGYECEVERFQNGSVSLIITDRQGNKKVDMSSHKFDPARLDSDIGFNALTDNLKRKFRTHYKSMNPRLERDLKEGNSDPITCGTYSFSCGSEFLFAGVVETVYLMRCLLFHGELVPTRQASDCYEPAYRIVRRFLESVT
jgi:hypothetical protein